MGFLDISLFLFCNVYFLVSTEIVLFSATNEKEIKYDGNYDVKSNNNFTNTLGILRSRCTSNIGTYKPICLFPVNIIALSNLNCSPMVSFDNFKKNTTKCGWNYQGDEGSADKTVTIAKINQFFKLRFLPRRKKTEFKSFECISHNINNEKNSTVINNSTNFANSKSKFDTCMITDLEDNTRYEIKAKYVTFDNETLEFFISYKTECGDFLKKIIVTNTSTRIIPTTCGNSSLQIRMAAVCLDKWCEKKDNAEISSVMFTPAANYSLPIHLLLKRPFTRFVIKYYIGRAGENEIYFEKKYFTKPKEPLQVQNLTIYSRNDTTVWFKWKPPYPPTGEVIKYVAIAGNATVTVLANSTIQNCINYICGELSGLHSNKSFNLSVRALNKDVSKWGKEATITIPAGEGYSLPPGNLGYSFNETECKIFWHHPGFTNGPIKYFTITIINLNNNISKIYNRNIKFEAPTYHTKILLDYGTTYNVAVAAANKHVGAYGTIKVTSPPPIPKVETIVYSFDSTCVIQISPMTNISQHVLTHLYIIDGTKFLHHINCSEIDDNFFTENITLISKRLKNFKEIKFFLNDYDCSFDSEVKNRNRFLVIFKTMYVNQKRFSCYNASMENNNNNIHYEKLINVNSVCLNNFLDLSTGVIAIGELLVIIIFLLIHSTSYCIRKLLCCCCPCIRGCKHCDHCKLKAMTKKEKTELKENLTKEDENFTEREQNETIQNLSSPESSLALVNREKYSYAYFVNPPENVYEEVIE